MARPEGVMHPQDLGIGRLFETVHDAVIVADASTGRIVLWNPAATEVFGYSPEEALGLSVEEIVPERLKERHRAGLSRYRDTGRGPYIDSGAVLDLPAVHKGGEEIRVELSLSPIEPLPEAEAEGRFVLAVVRDVTERKEAEEEKARLARYAALRADVSVAFDEGGSLRSILQRCTECMVGHLDAAFVRIWTLGEGENVLELRASAGMYTHLDGPHGRVPVGEFKIGLIAQEGMPHLTNYVLDDPRISDKGWAEREGMVAFAGYPLMVEGRVVGVAAMFARHPLKDDTIEALASVADTLAQGIERKRAEEEIRKLNEKLEDRVAERTARLETALAELKARERGLRESEERFRLMVEGVKDYAIFMLDPAGRVASWNEGARRIKGYEAEEVLGEHFSLFYPEGEVERGHPEEELRIAAEEGAYEEEGLRVRKDGSRFWASVLITALRDEEGNLRGFAKVTRDVTERKRSEEALRRQAELLDLSHEPIFAWEIGGGIVYWNRGSEVLYGFSREEAIGSDNHRLLRTVHPVPLKEVEAALDREGRWAGEIAHTMHDGRRVVVESRQMLVETSDGRRLVLETNRDVTERKRAEEAMAEVREAERNRMARDLHDGALQDLTYALAEVQLVQMLPDTAERNERLERAVEALKRTGQGLREAVYDLREEEGSSEGFFVRAVESLVDLNRKMNPDWEVKLVVGEGFLEELPKRVGKELLRVVQEALSNARRHSGAEHVRVALRIEGDDLVAEISDDGRGFDPGPTRAGVGLRSMSERAAALGGKFEVESEQEEGTRVRLRIPLRNVGDGGRG